MKALCVVAFAVAVVLASENVDVNDPEVQTLARDASKDIDKEFKEKRRHTLVEVRKAEKLNENLYVLEIILGLTKCLKSEVDFDQADECELEDSISTYKKCNTVIFQEKMLSFGCVLISKKDV